MLIEQYAALILELEASANYSAQKHDVMWLKNVSQCFGVRMLLSRLAPNTMHSSITKENLFTRHDGHIGFCHLARVSENM